MACPPPPCTYTFGRRTIALWLRRKSIYSSPCLQPALVLPAAVSQMPVSPWIFPPSIIALYNKHPLQSLNASKCFAFVCHLGDFVRQHVLFSLETIDTVLIWGDSLEVSILWTQTWFFFYQQQNADGTSLWNVTSSQNLRTAEWSMSPPLYLLQVLLLMSGICRAILWPCLRLEPATPHWKKLHSSTMTTHQCSE